MPVATQTYTASATWSASQLANIFRSAFIDSGLMTEWHDSFLSGTVENRVLEIVYDGAKTYGKTYYWFQFTTSGVFVSIASGWNAATDTPTGAQYLDFVSNATNTTGNHVTLMSMSATTTTTLRRFTSGLNAGHSWYLLRHGASSLCFRIARGAETRAPWIDLDRILFKELQVVACAGSGNSAYLTFLEWTPMLRRTLAGMATLRSNVATGNHIYTYPLRQYIIPGNVSNAATTNFSGWSGPPAASLAWLGWKGVILPVAFNNTNPAYAADSIPIFTGLDVSPYCNTVLPADFGIIPHFAANTMAIGDIFVVAAGSEEWEVLAFSNGSNTTGAASIMFGARVI